jgi:hypothetical protein
MVRIIVSLLLTLALPLRVASADDAISPNQLESLASVAAGLAAGQTGTVILTIDSNAVPYAVTKDALGNITAAGPAYAQIQTIAIATGTSGGATNVPLAVTVIALGGVITNFNIATNSAGQVTGVTATNGAPPAVKGIPPSR